MSNTSNRTLGIFLVVAMLVSITGALLVLDSTNTKITGFVTNQTTGQVDLSVLSSVSISLIDSSINFGTCDLSGRSYTYVNSSAANTSFHNQYCNYTENWGSSGDNITVRNDGNVYANITVKTNVNSTDFFTDATNPGDSWFKFWTGNASSNPGCVGNLQTNTLFVDASTEYIACDNLSIGTSDPGIELYIEANMTQTVSATSDSITLTFTAYEA